MRESESSLELCVNEQLSSSRVGRYAMCGEIAVGGAGRIHIGRVAGPGGFVRTIAIKSLHSQLARIPEYVASFTREAQLASRIRHPNVVSPLDVVFQDSEPFIVMDYVEGLTLAELLRLASLQRKPLALSVLATIMVDVLRGLHAAHEALEINGQKLGIVHRDVSPPNIIVGRDGLTRILDFGIAMSERTAELPSAVKGRLGYMAPEQLQSGPVDRRADIFAAAIVFWEALASNRLFRAATDAETVQRTLQAKIPGPSAYNPNVSPALDALILRALARDPSERFATADDFAQAIEATLEAASIGTVQHTVNLIGHGVLSRRTMLLEKIERYLDDVPRLPDEEAIDLLTPPTRPIPAGWRANSTATTIVALPSKAQPSQTKKRTALWLTTLTTLVVAASCVMGTRTSEPQATASISANSPSATPALRARTLAKASIAKRTAPAVQSTHTNDADAAIPLWTPPPTQSMSALPAPRNSFAPNKNCDPPYTIDAQGIRRIKLACI